MAGRLPLQSTFFVVGILLTIIGAIMVVPMAVDGIAGNPDWLTFLESAVVTVFVGGALALSSRSPRFEIRPGQGFLLTTLSWISVAAAASLPYMIGVTNLGFTDAFFEAMSGLTTTGSTVIVGLDKLPPGILLWRSMTQWVGGIGIIVMAMIMLPFLRIGGMQLFRSEASADRQDKPMARASEVAAATAVTYLVLTAMCAVALAFAGMGAFDAVCHAMTTLATGGFSTKDDSIGFYHSPAIEWVEVVFMTAGALPLFFFVQLVRNGAKAFAREGQVQAFLSVLLASIVAMTLWNFQVNHMPIDEAIRKSAFNVTSIVTDTGYATDDFGLWGPFAIGMFYAFYFIGGCAGSTAGAIKVFRWRILFASAVNQIRRTLSPHWVLKVKYADQVVPDDVADSVRNFFFLYMVTFIGISILLMLTGLDFISSTSSVAQAMANAGPGLGPIVGPAGNFSSLAPVAKWLLVAAMLLGRLELLTVYAVFTRSFWRI